MDNNQSTIDNSQLPEGYQQTEVGVIPEDWDVKELASLITAGPKNGYSGRAGGNAKGTPTLRLTATSSGYLIINDETVKQLDEIIDPNSDLFLKPGDVLIQRSNTYELVGTTAVFEGLPKTYVYPDLMMRLRFSEQLIAHWFWKYANSTNGRRFFLGTAAGSTGSMPKISGAKLREMPVPLPPENERKSIAQALSDVDRLIAALDTAIAKQRAIKTATMQQLLTGKKRLPGFGEGKGYQQTEIGVIPEDWRIDRIASLASISTGSRNTQDRVEDGLYPFFVRSQTVERINSYSFDGEAVLTAGDGVGTGKVFHYITGKFDVHQRVYRISNFSPALDGFFFYTYFSNYFYDRIMSMTAKSSVDSVRMEMIADMLMPLPQAKEQQEIATVLSDMDAAISALETRLAKTQSLKQGMMQQLLTGRIRLV